MVWHGGVELAIMDLYCECPWQLEMLLASRQNCNTLSAIIDACVFNYFDVQIVDEICVILAPLLSETSSPLFPNSFSIFRISNSELQIQFS